MALSIILGVVLGIVVLFLTVPFQRRPVSGVATGDEVIRVARNHFDAACNRSIDLAEQLGIRTANLDEKAAAGVPLSQKDIEVMAANAAMNGNVGTIQAMDLATKALAFRETEKQAASSGQSSQWMVDSLMSAEAQVTLVAGRTRVVTYRLERINGIWKVM